MNSYQGCQARRQVLGKRAANYQPSAFSNQLSAVGKQLTVLSGQLEESGWEAAAC
jgi:hypothetical protein